MLMFTHRISIPPRWDEFSQAPVDYYRHQYHLFPLTNLANVEKRAAAANSLQRKRKTERRCCHAPAVFWSHRVEHQWPRTSSPCPQTRANRNSHNGAIYNRLKRICTYVHTRNTQRREKMSKARQTMARLFNIRTHGRGPKPVPDPGGPFNVLKLPRGGQFGTLDICRRRFR